MATLQNLLSKLEKELRPSEEQRRRACKLEGMVRSVCEQLDGEIHRYGSCSNGTFMQGSDVDLTWLCDQSQMAQRASVSSEARITRAPIFQAPPASGNAEGVAVRKADSDLQKLLELEALVPPPPPDAAPLPPTPPALERQHEVSIQERRRPSSPPRPRPVTAEQQTGAAEKPLSAALNPVAEQPQACSDARASHDAPSAEASPQVTATAPAAFSSLPLPPEAPAEAVEEPRERRPSASSQRLQQFRALRLLRWQAERSSLPGVQKLFVVNARVPVLKFYGNDGEVLCDVSINNHEGLQNSRLTLGFCRSERILGPVVRLLKHWARGRRLADRSTGGFSTYTLVLMAVKSLQSGQFQKKTLSEECVQALAQRVLSDDSPKPLKRFMYQAVVNAEHVAKAFVGFFEYFAQPSWSSGGLVRVTPPAEPKDSLAGKAPEDEASTVPGPEVPPPPPLGILQVFCPLTQSDVQRSKAQEWQHMAKEIVRAREILRNAQQDGQQQLEDLFKDPQEAQKPPPPPKEAWVVPADAVLPGRITEEEAEQSIALDSAKPTMQLFAA